MQQFKFNYRFFLKPNGRVFLRVRWNSGRQETGIALPVLADSSKWSGETQRAIRNTFHEVNGYAYTARSINNEIEHAIDEITTLFQKCSLQGELPTTTEVKKYLTEVFPNKLEPIKENKPDEKEVPLDELYESFIHNYGQENNWAVKTRYKYDQAFNLMKAYQANVKIADINKKFFNGFKIWLIEQGYKNSSITKYFRCLRTILKWIHGEGYSVSEDALNYRTKLAVPQKVVIYLSHDEILQFEKFQFPAEKAYLSRARDMFCFMCYTSLRYCDLRGLKKAAISDGIITMHSQKTKGQLRIPLIRHAMAILDRYIESTPGEYVFPVPSLQKLNDYLKEGAKMAGLNREVMDTTYCGNERIETVMKLHEAISCHDARRTFVCISLSLGIPQTVVMSCTGHADYTTMKPYIAISDETSRQELVKWEVGSVRNEINKILDAMSEDELQNVLQNLKSEFL